MTLRNSSCIPNDCLLTTQSSENESRELTTYAAHTWTCAPWTMISLLLADSNISFLEIVFDEVFKDQFLIIFMHTYVGDKSHAHKNKMLTWTNRD